MFGTPDVLIDFARSRVGPVAIDLAKLLCDALVRRPSLRGSQCPQWSDLKGPWRRLLSPTLTRLAIPDENAVVFDTAVLLNLLECLSYPDVEEEAKKWALACLLGLKLGIDA